MPEAKSRAQDNLGRVHARVGNFQKAIEVFVLIELKNNCQCAHMLLSTINS